LSLIHFQVDTSVNFDYQPEFMAVEIRDRASDWKLTPEFMTEQPAIAQARPNHGFGFSGMFTKLAAKIEKILGDFADYFHVYAPPHPRPPSPPTPLPLAGEGKQG
jgi:hypothetical protein